MKIINNTKKLNLSRLILTFILVLGDKPKPSFNRTEIKVKSRHIKGWSTFASLQADLAALKKSSTMT